MAWSDHCGTFIAIAALSPAMRRAQSLRGRDVNELGEDSSDGLTRRDDGPMDANVEQELQAVLRWTHAVRAGMESSPDRREELQMQGHAYTGGVLTTLDHLGLVTAGEHSEWWQRLNEVLGDPPGGWISFRFSDS